MKPDFDEREAHETGDTLPEQAGVYVPPRTIAPLSEHRTMDVKAIRIAAEIDPRQALTQLRMQPPPRRRSGTPTLVGYALLFSLLVAGTYLAFAPDKPLPLVTAPTPGQAAVPALPAAKASPESARPVPAAAPAVMTPAAPVAEKASLREPAAPPAASPEPEPAPTRVRAPKASKGSAPRPRQGAAQSGKVARDPWLE